MQKTMTHRRRWRHLAWGLALAMVTVSVASGRTDRRHPGKLSERARAEAGRKGTAKMNVIVRFRRAPGAPERMLVQGFGGQMRRHLKDSSRWMAVQLPAHLLARMSDNPIIDFVAVDSPVASSGTMDVARATSGAAPVDVPESGLKGAGVTIAMVDSGVAPHPEIPTPVVAVDFVNVPGAVIPMGDNGAPIRIATSIDPYGHGTHVAGIMVGNGSHSPDARFAGIAPEAHLVSVRVLDSTGRGMTSDVLAGLQWVLDNKDQYGIRVLNLSLGHPVFEPADTDPLVQAVDALWDAGVVVVCSSGNDGRSGYGTITSPCNSRKVITVGALNDMGTADRSDDTIASYSSRGPAVIDLVAKPDLVAPGNRIVSALSPGSYMDSLFPDRRVAADPNQPGVQEFCEMSGTSMASPMVAATAALMLEQDPSLTNDTIKARLMLSARKTAIGHPFATGAGALDILGALRETGQVTQALSPHVTADADSGQLSVENPAVLWGNDQFSIMNLWSSAVIWSDPTQYAQPTAWSSGLLWPDAELWPEADLWPEAEFWPEAVLWPDQPLWGEAALWPDAGVDVVLQPLAIGIQDK
jgi:serine protease AprX